MTNFGLKASKLDASTLGCQRDDVLGRHRAIPCNPALEIIETRLASVLRQRILYKGCTNVEN